MLVGILEMLTKLQMIINKIKSWAVSVKNNLHALYLASIDNRVPKLTKILIGLIVAYALSPIDLIPDFIPVLGYLDDLILLPLGIWLAIHFVPQEVWKECQILAKEKKLELPRNRSVVVVIVIIWFIAMIAFILWLWPLIYSTKST